MTKHYDAKVGVNVDADFTTHRARCARCKGFDDKPSSLAGLCLEGSILWKQANQGGGKRMRAERPDTFVSKEQLKQVMKYKE